jgi:hypothetical protein
MPIRLRATALGSRAMSVVSAFRLPLWPCPLLRKFKIALDIIGGTA